MQRVTRCLLSNSIDSLLCSDEYKNPLLGRIEKFALFSVCLVHSVSNLYLLPILCEFRGEGVEVAMSLDQRSTSIWECASSAFGIMRHCRVGRFRCRGFSLCKEREQASFTAEIQPEA